MMAPRVSRNAAALLLVLGAFAAWARGQDAPTETVVLDTSGFWRYFYVLKPPVVIHDDGRIERLPHPSADTPYPPKSWTLTEFDDSHWLRQRGASFPTIRNLWAPMAHWQVGGTGYNVASPCVAMTAVRGKFSVTDPAKVQRLRVSMTYRGGAILYVNGTEIARQHLPDDRKNADAGAEDTAPLAQKYPREAYFYPDGSLLDHDYRTAEQVKDRYLLRNRTMTDVPVPTGLLRKGVNVLALEVRRAPYDAAPLEKYAELKEDHRVAHSLWDTCNMVRCRLTADTAEGLVPNVVRPKGLQVWNSDVLVPDFDLDFGDPNEPLRPVVIVGTRCGSFSGEVVVGSSDVIRGLRAKVTDLVREGGGVIPSRAVRIRYALPDGAEVGSQSRYLATVNRFDGLDETPPAEVPVRTKERNRDNWTEPGTPAELFGAVVPVWITVNVPPDTPAGDYTATLTVTAEAAAPVEVPLRLKVHAFNLPPPHDFRTFCEIIPSPDSLAIRYGVPPWTDEHFRLIEQSFRILAEVGNRTVYVPLICHTNLGNSGTMVRWVKKPGGGYTYDFSVLDRYLDLYEKHCGLPQAVCIGVWEAFLEGGTLRYAREGRYAATEIWEDFDKAKGLGPLVTLFDPAGGKTQDLQLPLYTAEEKSKGLWKPLLDELRERMRKRGWEKQMLLGYCHDAEPAKEVVDFFRELMPGVGWLRQAHSGRKDIHGSPYELQMLVWQPRFLMWPDADCRHGWRSPFVQFPRNIRDWYPNTTLRLIGEMNLIGEQCGFGRLGGGFWNVIEDKRGRPAGTVAMRYPKVRWRNLTIATAMFSPGETGPLSTVRVEMIREGLQECEARIAIEEALVDETKRKRLGDDLVRRCESALTDRTLVVLQGLDNHLSSGFRKSTGHSWWNEPGQVGSRWYLHSGWQERSDQLYALAGEVQRKLQNP